MASSGKYYFILHPEKTSPLELFLFLLFGGNISDYNFAETNVAQDKEAGFGERLFIVGILLYLKFLTSVGEYWDKHIQNTEFVLNLLSLNGGLFGLIWRSLTGSVVSPQRDTASFRSYQSFLSKPILDKNTITATTVKYAPLHDIESGSPDLTLLMTAILASQLALENAERCKDVVDNEWGMSFQQFFECYNIWLEANETEAIVFCDKATDAQLIVLAFRGSTDSLDYRVDIDFSWLDTGVMGQVHIGFMTALGLQNDKSFADGFPAEYTGSLDLAYYSIRDLLTKLISQNPNAKILITGHSLGGALSILFTSLLSYHGRKDILDKVQSVMTFGQPRVGNEGYVKYMAPVLADIGYIRMVYRFDLVPRIPFDLPVWFDYKHCTPCLQYDGWYKGKMVETMTDNNYFNILYLVPVYWGYFVDFGRCIWLGIKQGIWEGWPATWYRIKCFFLPGLIFHTIQNYIYSAQWAVIDSASKIKD